MKPEFAISDVARVMARVKGLRIISGEETDDGLHLNLEGGHVLIFTGEMVIAIYQADTEVRVH